MYNFLNSYQLFIYLHAFIYLLVFIYLSIYASYLFLFLFFISKNILTEVCENCVKTIPKFEDVIEFRVHFFAVNIYPWILLISSTKHVTGHVPCRERIRIETINKLISR